MGEKLNFSIDHIDPLGQGVHKSESGVCFIHKTLPGDRGSAELVKRSKGVSFAKLISIDEPSPHRIKPECEHFTQCPGCQFLHAPYEFELETKRNSLLRMLKPLGCERVIAHAAPRRWSYRNRMQLHYDLTQNRLGHRTPQGIIEIPNCLMPNDELMPSFKELQTNWKSLVAHLPTRQGHIEIYASETGVKTSINQPYAEGGFSQVFSEMNEKALALVQKFTSKLAINSALDLFGGAGNLSKHLNCSTLVVDGVIPSAELTSKQKFIQLDLYASNALHALNKHRDEVVDLMLVDPPRSGFLGLDKFIEKYDPKYLVYMSCFAPTMIRDLKQAKIGAEEIHLLDFFPSTHHVESLALLRLK
tara:strand:- start:3133 stop:4212 length:1080 start_codon:yes stop_codon:yes gene_type:complete